MKKNRPNTQSDLVTVRISKYELENLIQARTERDLILAYAIRNNFTGYKMEDLLKALVNLNGLGDVDA